MEPIRLSLFWTTASLYLATFFAAAFFMFFKKERLSRLSVWTLRAGFMAHLALLIFEWIQYSRFPLFKDPMIAVLILLFFQFFLKKDLTQVSFFLMIIVIAIFLISGNKDPSIIVNAVHDSKWLIVHVVFAWFAFACLAVATALACIYLLKSYKEHFMPEFYSLEIIDRTAYRLVALGVLFQFGMIASGMMWAKELYGRYWAWDPVEVASLVVLVFYVLYSHARLLLKFRGRGAAWTLIVGIILVIMSLWGLKLITPGDHLMDPDSSMSR